MANRVIFVSSRCEYCEKLLIGVQQYDILKRTFSIVNIDTEPFPNYIKEVPSLLINNQIIKGEELFDYMGRIVDASGESQPQEQREQPQQQQPQQGQQQQQQPQQLTKNQGNMQCSVEDELMGFCTNNSGVEYSTITETNDDYTKSFHTLDSNLEFLDGQSDIPNGNHSQVQLSKDDNFDISDKRKEFDSDYEKLMSDRRL